MGPSAEAGPSPAASRAFDDSALEFGSTSIDDIEVQIFGPDDGNWARVMGMNLEGGNAQITDTTVLTASCSEPRMIRCSEAAEAPLGGRRIR